MATMMDRAPEDFYGEKIVWDALSKVLPKDVIVYNHREVGGLEFDFLLVIEEVGLIVLEVKGWTSSNIVRVESPDGIFLKGLEHPTMSPKKQSRKYRFALIDSIKKRFNSAPLVLDFVCYPFLSEIDYQRLNLHVCSEPEHTVFSEDLQSLSALGSKINQAASNFNNLYYRNLDGEMISEIRNMFEPMIPIEKIEGINDRLSYSLLIAKNSSILGHELDSIIASYVSGTKIILFLKNNTDLEYVEKRLIEVLAERKLFPSKEGLVLIQESIKQLDLINNNGIRLFNFEAYAVPDSQYDIRVIDGLVATSDRETLIHLSNLTSFNIDQFEVEHAPLSENLILSAGAGTGKTTSMIARIAYLCNNRERPIVSLSESIAMVTFTNDAADNMKLKLKDLFLNLFLLTRNPKHINRIEEIDQMQIATIHKFAKTLIQKSSIHLGIGYNFSITSGSYTKEKIYDKYLEEHLQKKKKVNPDYLVYLDLRLYELRKVLLKISESLYSKSMDIKNVTESMIGAPVSEFPELRDLILEVVVEAEKEYSTQSIKLNKVDLRESMILLKKAIHHLSNLRATSDFYEYLFIDEFQDTDDIQIQAFLQLQQLMGFKFFVVGDIKQSIYRFRGATEQAFSKLPKDEKGWRRYTLNRNYRTDYRLLKGYEKIFRDMGSRDELPFNGENDQLYSQIKYPNSEDCLIKCIQYCEQDDDFYEKLFSEVQDQIDSTEQLAQNNRLSVNERTLAILVRENWQIRSILKEARERDIDIETQVGGDLFQSEPAIDFYKLILAFLNPLDPIYLVNLIESNNVNTDFKSASLIGKNRAEQTRILTKALDKFYGACIEMKWTQVIRDLHNKPVLAVIKRVGDGAKPWMNSAKELDAQREYHMNYELVLETLLKSNSQDYITLDRIEQSMMINILTAQEVNSRQVIRESKTVRVLCTTIHKAKGLEYGVVLLPFTSQQLDSKKKVNVDSVIKNEKMGYLVKIGERNPKNEHYDIDEEIAQRVQEEGRILYVAMTRAMRSFIWFNSNQGGSGKTWRKMIQPIEN